MENNYSLLLKTVQKHQLSILQSFHEFCEENDIKYSLAYGSLLGALRHDGFIPWDDDIDLVMSRDNYEKFLTLKEKLPSKLYVQNYLIDSSYFPFTKIRLNDSKMVMKSSSHDDFHQGIWIDIFPLDEMPKEGSLYFKVRYYYIANLIAIVSSVSYSKIKASRLGFNRILRTVYFFLTKIFGVKMFKKLLDKSMKKKFGDDNPRLYDLSTATILNDYGTFSILKESMENLIPHDFEEHEYYVPFEADAILREVYGDYMTPPALEKQHPHHQVLLLEIDGKNYFKAN